MKWWLMVLLAADGGIRLSFWIGLYALTSDPDAVLSSFAADVAAVAVVSLLDETPCFGLGSCCGDEDVHSCLTKVFPGWPLLMVDRFQLMLGPSGFFAKPIIWSLLNLMQQGAVKLLSCIMLLASCSSAASDVFDGAEVAKPCWSCWNAFLAAVARICGISAAADPGLADVASFHHPSGLGLLCGRELCRMAPGRPGLDLS
ncbi:hypothetical protein Nepgr_023060 [Nepenthes gracilis]|uniref:Uncharacterized protein n=1 Tax=Nepenthes gracilis TaxID=150966 RepID=A0AAD3T1D5_NEPGR|nr:hypothetical protein Nepgr_023060 [Nepenthes gracilis]